MRFETCRRHQKLNESINLKISKTVKATDPLSFQIWLRLSVTKLCYNTCSFQAHNSSTLYTINIICETNILGVKSPFLQIHVGLDWAHAAPYSVGNEANM
jgi:hypothetical protein